MGYGSEAVSILKLGNLILWFVFPQNGKYREFGSFAFSFPEFLVRYIAHESCSCRELDQKVRDAFHLYIEARGINEKLFAFLQAWLYVKDHRNLMRWFKSVGAFINEQKTAWATSSLCTFQLLFSFWHSCFFIFPHSLCIYSHCNWLEVVNAELKLPGEVL